jgi:hypothetical protein
VSTHLLGTQSSVLVLLLTSLLLLQKPTNPQTWARLKTAHSTDTN